MRSLLLLLGVLAFSSDLHAQITPGLTTAGVSYKRFFTEGELTMEVFVISSTGQTGIYEIGTDTRLLELITVAGFAPPARTAQTSVRNTLSVVRPGVSSEPIYEARMEDFVLEPERHPTLEDGDVILIESVQKQKFTWREAVTIVSGVSSLLLLAGRLGILNFRRY